MDPSLRPPGGSVVVREAPPSAGGGLRYLGRDPAGRGVWISDAARAERHPSLREASRAALTAPPLPGAVRPAYAVPVSVADAQPEVVVRPPLRLVALEGETVGPSPNQSTPPVVPNLCTRIRSTERAPEFPPNPAAWLWMVWAPWFAVWSGLLFGPDGVGQDEA